MFQRSAARARLEGYSPILATLITTVAFLYVMNAFGNLRLNGDAVTLLSSAISSAQGSGRVFHGHPTVYPPGYPFIVEVLLRLRIASSYTIVLVNCVLLSIGVTS